MFLTFALITLVGAVSMFFQRNLIVAGLSLVLCFLGVAGLFLLLSNPVAAALQVIVYSGAIVVLVLFVIMLLNAHEEEAEAGPHRIQRWGGVAVMMVLGAGVVRLLMRADSLRSSAPVADVEPMTLNHLGTYLFREHLLAFEAAGLLLLAAMVAAVMLVKKEL